jgi:hypothetical protein
MLTTRLYKPPHSHRLAPWLVALGLWLMMTPGLTSRHAGSLAVASPIVTHVSQPTRPFTLDPEMLLASVLVLGLLVAAAPSRS